MLPLEEPPLAPWLLDILIWWAATLDHIELCYFLGHLSWDEHRPADMEENMNTPLHNPELVLRNGKHPLFCFSWVYDTEKDTWIINLVFLLCIYILYSCTSIFLTDISLSLSFSSVQFRRSVVSNSATAWIAAHQASLCITNSWSLLKLMPIESVMPSSHLILSHPLLLLAPIPPNIRVFSNESILRIRWPKYWSFNFSISPSNEHPGLISFRMDWLDFLVVQGALKSLLQTPQFKGINFSVLSFLHSPTLTSIHDHWKNHSLDQTDLCWQRNVSAF